MGHGQPCLLFPAGRGLPLSEPCQGRREHSTQELYLGSRQWRHADAMSAYAATRPLKRSWSGMSLIPQDQGAGTDDKCPGSRVVIDANWPETMCPTYRRPVCAMSKTTFIRWAMVALSSAVTRQCILRSP